MCGRLRRGVELAADDLALGPTDAREPSQSGFAEPARVPLDGLHAVLGASDIAAPKCPMTVTDERNRSSQLPSEARGRTRWYEQCRRSSLADERAEPTPKLSAGAGEAQSSKVLGSFWSPRRSVTYELSAGDRSLWEGCDGRGGCDGIKAQFFHHGWPIPPSALTVAGRSTWRRRSCRQPLAKSSTRDWR